jgi:branched-chain amino acid transport system permease protein
MAISAIIIYKIASSKTGVVFVSLLDDELASKACGINVTKYKIMAFALSGLFGSLAGCVYAYLFGRATPDFLGISFSLIPITVTILGGIGTIYGPLVGTYIYYLLNNLLTNYIFPKAAPQFSGYAPLLIFMLLVIIFVVKWPRGISRVIVDKLDDLQEPREIEEIEKKKVKRFGWLQNVLTSSTQRLRERKKKGET